MGHGEVREGQRLRGMNKGERVGTQRKDKDSHSSKKDQYGKEKRRGRG